MLVCACLFRSLQNDMSSFADIVVYCMSASVNCCLQIRDKMSGVLLHDLERYSENDSSHTNSFSSIQTDVSMHSQSD